ncbi:MAG TPA: class I SAM-dependent methyltransferase [Candidatus Dormibacteraeota bacterium]|jgi:SAM-dependent methyltransferase|nr:class I SAM-dependent methyltransferase [Candidatus Dormibacteraeota bacterium]
MRLLDSLLERTAVYSTWQAPFVKPKFAPVLRDTNLASIRSVLDVGCGPGTNTALFSQTGYLGVDINPRYIESARKRFKRDFLVADVTTYEDVPKEKFDLVLLNSFLHHVDDDATNAILSRMHLWVSENGFIHILELVYPPKPSIPQFLAKADRGKFPRRLEHWRSLFERHLNIEHFEPYPLKKFGLTLWDMIYCRGTPR